MEGDAEDSRRDFSLPSSPRSNSVNPPQGASNRNQFSNIATIRIPTGLSALFGFDSALNALSRSNSVSDLPLLSRESTEDLPSSEDPPPIDSPEEAPEEEDSSEENEPLWERRTSVELRSLFQWLETNVPFLLILGIYFVHQHKLGIFVYLWLTSTILRANEWIKRQVALREQRQLGTLLLVIFFLFTHIAFIYLIFWQEQLWRALLIVISPKQNNLTIWDALFIVAINDTLVRFAVMIVKCSSIILVGHIPPHKRRKQMYATIELLSNTYRQMLPISIWMNYLGENEAYQTFGLIMGGLYITFKVAAIRQQLITLILTLRAFFLNQAQYGEYATPEQLAEAGEAICSICQDDLRQPLILSCQHMFCEECVTEWFEREKTCPICRAVVPTAGNHLYSDGGTSLAIQIF